MTEMISLPIKESDIVFDTPDSLSPWIFIQNQKVGLYWGAVGYKEIKLSWGLTLFGISNQPIKCERHEIKQKLMELFNTPSK